MEGYALKQYAALLVHEVAQRLHNHTIEARDIDMGNSCYQDLPTVEVRASHRWNLYDCIGKGSTADDIIEDLIRHARS